MKKGISENLPNDVADQKNEKMKIELNHITEKMKREIVTSLVIVIQK